MKEEFLLSRSIHNVPHHQMLAITVLGGLLLHISGQFTTTGRGSSRSAERDVHVSTTQFRRKRCSDLEHNIQLVFGRLIDDGCNSHRWEERFGRAVIHRSKTSLGTGKVKNVLLLKCLHIHRWMVIHVINKDGTRRSLS